MSYSIIQAITNHYDTVHECNDENAAKRILFLDKPTNAKTWEVRHIDSNKEHPFDDIFKIRWNPFEFANTDYVVWIDGSLTINKSIKKYIDRMIELNADVATFEHPIRKDIYNEYRVWVKTRHYDKAKAFSWMYFMEENGWNPKNVGLYQVNMFIFKNTPRVREFCKTALETLHNFDKDHLERLDQTVISFLLNTKFNDLKVMKLSTRQCYGAELGHRGGHPAR